MFSGRCTAFFLSTDAYIVASVQKVHEISGSGLEHLMRRALCQLRTRKWADRFNKGLSGSP
jgi:hypothetical protein